MKFRKKLIGMMLALFLTIFSLGITVTPTYASGNPCSLTTNCFNGFSHTFSSNSLMSIFTNIWTPAYPANYPNSASNAWPMIANQSSTYETQYVQVGWITTQGTIKGYYGSQSITWPTNTHYFYEINYGQGTGYNKVALCSQCDYQVFNTYGPAEWSSHDYRVALENGNWVGTEDGVTIGSFPDYSGDISFTAGNEAQYYEELVSPSGQEGSTSFAGTVSAHARFINIRAFANGTTYYSPSPDTEASEANGVHDLSHYSSGYSDQSQSRMDLWDSRFQ